MKHTFMSPVLVAVSCHSPILYRRLTFSEYTNALKAWLCYKMVINICFSHNINVQLQYLLLFIIHSHKNILTFNAGKDSHFLPLSRSITKQFPLSVRKRKKSDAHVWQTCYKLSILSIL